MSYTIITPAGKQITIPQDDLAAAGCQGDGDHESEILDMGRYVACQQALCEKIRESMRDDEISPRIVQSMTLDEFFVAIGYRKSFDVISAIGIDNSWYGLHGRDTLRSILRRWENI